MRDRTRMRAIVAAAVAAGVGLGAMTGCKLHRKLPWVSTETVVSTAPAMPPVMLGSVEGLHVAIMRAPSGGWTLQIDKSVRTAEGMRVYLTARRPDPAFNHTQAMVDLNALSDVPIETDVTVVGRVLERDAKPKDSVYGPVTPVGSLD